MSGRLTGTNLNTTQHVHSFLFRRPWTPLISPVLDGMKVEHEGNHLPVRGLPSQKHYIKL